MLQRYSEIQQESSADARDRERAFFEQCIELLEAAQAKGPRSMEAVKAVHFTNKLWSALLQDLGNPDNARDDELRAGLISIGIWILRECEHIRQEESDNISGLLEIVRTIREAYK